MAYRSFRHFLETLEQAGELTRVADPVDTNLLITEWADREMKSPGGGKALLFEQPVIDGKISKFAVAINTMGSRKRIAMALGRESIEEIAQEIQLILKAKPPTDLREGWSLLKQGIHLLHARPKSVREAACQEVVQILDTGYSMLDKKGSAGRNPASSNRPSGSDHPASSIQHPGSGRFTLRDLPLLKCCPKDGGRFITLPNLHTRAPESGARNVGGYRMQTFDDHTWSYTAVEGYPLVELTEITHRRHAIYPTTIVGMTPMEDYCLGDATVRIFLPVFKMNYREFVDMTLPPEGVVHNLVFGSI